MGATIVDGQKIADNLTEKIRAISQSTPPKKVCFVSFNDSPVSKSFVEKKLNFAKNLGVEANSLHSLAASTEEAVAFITSLTEGKFDGIVVQLPVRKNLDTETILNSVPHNVDIDMLGTDAKDAYDSGSTERVPPVARAVSEILEEYKIAPNGKKIVSLGFGRLVGKPVSSFLKKKNFTYEILDKDTSPAEKSSSLLSADIIISGIGVPHFLKPNMIKDGVILIDAGTSGEEGKISGDIDPACLEKAYLFTPVPGGVGPITVASLFYNLYLN